MQLTIPIPGRQETVRLPAGAFDWNEDEFFYFCQANLDLRIERSAMTIPAATHFPTFAFEKASVERKSLPNTEALIKVETSGLVTNLG